MRDAATRLIIKDLPKDCDEASLIKHIKARCGDSVASELTDCRIIRHNGKSRRIAYVGFKTPESALTCQKLSDKTFINTSKLSVSPALKQGDSELPRAWSKITKEKKPQTKATSEEDKQNLARIQETGRLMIINIPYETTADDLQKLGGEFGKIVEIKLPKKLKGMAYITYAFAPAAMKAYVELNNSSFMGRQIRCRAADESVEANTIERVLSKHTLKSQAKAAILEKKLKRNSESQNWNLLYVSASVATEVVAQHLGVEVEDIVGTDNTLSGDSIAAKVAVAESFIVMETKKWLANLGLPESIFIGKGTSPLSAKLELTNDDDGAGIKAGATAAADQSSLRSKQTLFIKHLGPWVEDGEELRKLLNRFGHVVYFALAPTKTIAIASYSSASEATRTFNELALYNFHSKPLYLEFASALVDRKLQETLGAQAAPVVDQVVDQQGAYDDDSAGISSTIYITNLSFETTEAQLTEIFGAMPGFRKVSLLKSKKRVRDLSTGVSSEASISLGHGFVIFETSEQAQAAMKANLNLIIDGHAIQMDWSRSKESRDGTAKRPRKEEAVILPTSRKIIVKNLDFTTTAKDLKELFQTYGSVVSCRLPKRSDGRIRGFGFVEFATAADAHQAVTFLKDVRLLGRRLVIQSAEADDKEQDPCSSTARESSQLESALVESAS